MQRTVFTKRSGRESDNYRSLSVDVKSPTQIMQLIKLKRYSINKTNVDQLSLTKSSEWKPIKLALPKIHQSVYPALQPSRSLQISTQTPKPKQQIPSHTRHIQHKITIPTLQIDEDNQSQEELQLARCTTIMYNIMKQFPKLSKSKNMQNLKPLVEFLLENNPFFKNIHVSIIVAFLKTCKIKQVPKRRWIYKKDYQLNSFFIILWGKMKIINTQKNFKKISVRGETLSEQILFNEFMDNAIRGQGAKAATHCFLLQITYNTYLKVYKQLVIKGYKTDFLTMQKLIKRNYVLKQGLKYQISQR